MKRLSLLLLPLLLTTSAVRAQWSQTNGPEGGFVVGLVAPAGGPLALVSPNRLYHHDGSRWSFVDTLSAGQLLQAGKVLLATTAEGLLRSTDGGLSWSPTGRSRFTTVVGVQDSIVFANDDISLYRSNDAGLTWSHLVDFGPDVMAAVAHGNTIVLSIDGDVGIRRSTDNGATWTGLSADFPDSTGAALLTMQGDTMLAFVRNTIRYFGAHGIYRSINDGATWQPMRSGLEHPKFGYPHVSRIFSLQGRPAVATTVGVYLFGDGTWRLSSIGSASHVATDENGTLYVGGWEGVIRTTDTANVWRRMNEGMRAVDVSAVHVAGDALLASSATTIFRSTDNGTTWETVLRDGAGHFVTVGSTILTRPDYGMSDFIYRSTNGGETWNDALEGITRPVSTVHALAASGDTAYIGMRDIGGTPHGLVWRSGGVFRTTDQGRSWSDVSGDLPKQGEMPAPVNGLAAHGRTLIAATIAGNYRSLDGGEHWERIEMPTTNGFGEPIVFLDGAWYVTTSDAVYRSLDNGSTWMPLKGTPRSEGYYRNLQRLGDDLIVVEASTSAPWRVLRLHADSLQVISDALPADLLPTAFVEVGDDVIMATGGASVWRGRFDRASGVETPAGGEGLSTDLQPNPTTGDAYLTVSSTRAREVTITIADGVGRELHRERRSVAAGASVILVPVGGLPTGTYLYKVEGGAFRRGGVIVRR